MSTRQSICPPAWNAATPSPARCPTSPTETIQTTPTATADRTGSATVDTARVTSVRAKAGSNHAAAVQSRPGSVNAARPIRTSDASRTAVLRISSSMKLRSGAATPISYVGSIPGPNAAATPATGISGAVARNSTSPG